MESSSIFRRTNIAYVPKKLEEYKDRFLDLPEGTILFSDSKIGLYIKAKEGNIKVLEIQGENAKRMKAEDFLRGTYLAAGLCFE